MSHVATIHNYEEKTGTENKLVLQSSASKTEQAAARLMTLWMVLGIVVGGYLGYLSLQSSAGTSLPATTLICAIAGSVVGAALGQIIGGLFHVVANDSLEN
jgi:uncharacterized membrane protein